MPVYCASNLLHAGPPPPPANLSAVDNGPGLLNISWSLAFIEGVALEFTLTATKLNASDDSEALVVSGIQDQHYLFDAKDNTPCSEYHFKVEAKNNAGDGNSTTVVSFLPSLPDISPVEGSLTFYLVKNASEVTMNVVFDVRGLHGGVCM